MYSGVHWRAVEAGSDLSSPSWSQPHSSRLPREKVRKPSGFVLKLSTAPQSPLALDYLLKLTGNGDQEEDQTEGKTCQLF